MLSVLAGKTDLDDYRNYNCILLMVTFDAYAIIALMLLVEHQGGNLAFKSPCSAVFQYLFVDLLGPNQTSVDYRKCQLDS